MSALGSVEAPTAPTPKRVGKRWWVPALVLNITSGLLGILWALVLVSVGGIAELAAVFGRGGGDRGAMAMKGAGFIATGILVVVAPLLVGTTTAVLRRPISVMVSYACGVSMLVLPWCCLLGSGH